jgi:hypothetical protein
MVGYPFHNASLIRGSVHPTHQSDPTAPLIQIFIRRSKYTAGPSLPQIYLHRPLLYNLGKRVIKDTVV